MRIAKLAGAPVPMLLRTQGLQRERRLRRLPRARARDLDLHQARDRLRHPGHARRRRGTPNASAVTWSATAKPGGFKSARRDPGARGRGLRVLPRPRRPAPLARLRQGRQLPDRVRSAATTRPTRSASSTRASCPASRTRRTPAIAKLPPEREARAARRARRAAQGPAADRRRASSARRPAAAATPPSTRPGARRRTRTRSRRSRPPARQGDADCLRCHTTGFGRPGGFPEKGLPAEHADLAGVGCESCHGPGGDHVAEGAAKIGTIVSLGDKCDSCVILQICGACHDDANDPGFEFEVKEKIEKQRHGTLEPGTGKPKAKVRAARAPRRRRGAARAGLREPGRARADALARAACAASGTAASRP